MYRQHAGTRVLIIRTIMLVVCSLPWPVLFGTLIERQPPPCMLVMDTTPTDPTICRSFFPFGTLPPHTDETCHTHTTVPATPPAGHIVPYVRPSFARHMETLRPVIEQAAANHNRPLLSGMSNSEFAEVLVLILYNEQNGWLEDAIEPLRVVTPAYQSVQVLANRAGIGSNFSVWPSNLRPSVALEIQQQQVPLPNSTVMMTVPVQVAGSQIDLDDFPSDRERYAALTREISQNELAVEYLAANLERGLYRAHYEGVPVSWYTLAAWHNQGIVRQEHIVANAYACEYIYRASAYGPLARQFVAETDADAGADMSSGNAE